MGDKLKRLDSGPADGTVESQIAVMRRLATRLTGLIDEALPPSVEHEAERTLLNVLGTAIFSSSDPAVDQVLVVASTNAGRKVAPIPGRLEGSDLYFAAIATGLAAHLDDFDDTHVQSGNVHPGSVALAATLGIGKIRGATGPRFLQAFAVTCEVLIRTALSLAPAHHKEGWQPMSTCGAIASALGAGVLMGLNETQLANAASIGATRSLGHREALGTPAKAFHAGKAAANGVISGLLAERGFTAVPTTFEAPTGLAAVLARESDPERLLAGFGEEWELMRNTYKAYPCGVVCHPGIDAAIELSEAVGDLQAIQVLDYECHPLVLELVDRRDPGNGLEARFSAQHGVAVALQDRRAGLVEYSDARVRAADVTHLRSLIRLRPRSDFSRDEAALEATMMDGTRIRTHVPHARGSLSCPLTDAELYVKFEGLAEPVLPGASQRIADAVMGLGSVDGLNRLIDAVSPRSPE